MTSGKFTSHPIESIWVDRDTRQRKALSPESVASLAQSIAKVGLINPITIERSGQLRAGETRWAACKSLGWTSIPAQFVEDLDESELQLIELDENIKRTNLTWQEECAAVSRYHELRKAIEPDWTQAKTGEALGMDNSSVNVRIEVHKEMLNPTSQVHKATKMSEARTIVTRVKDRRAAAVLESIDPTSKIEREVPLLNADFNEWAPAYRGPKFNFLHCDFPYGINAQDQQQGGNAVVMGEYDDSPDTYFQLLSTLHAAMDNVVAESAHLIFWFSMRFYDTTFRYLTSMGWKVDLFPLIWHKSDNVGLLPDPLRGPRRTYETAFFASRGDRKIVAPAANSISSPTTKEIHMSEKPLPVLAHFFRMVIDEYSSVLDPTAGSANSVRCAQRAGAARVYALEKDTTFFNLAKEHFYD